MSALDTEADVIRAVVMQAKTIEDTTQLKLHKKDCDLPADASRTVP
jgi:hypothetical protein